MSESYPILAGQNATQPDALDLHALAVIGLIEGHNGAVAILRSSAGEIVRVVPGDVVFGVTVTAIGAAQVLLTDRAGRTQSLQLPHG